MQALHGLGSQACNRSTEPTNDRYIAQALSSGEFAILPRPAAGLPEVLTSSPQVSAICLNAYLSIPLIDSRLKPSNTHEKESIEKEEDDFRTVGSTSQGHLGEFVRDSLDVVSSSFALAARQVSCETRAQQVAIG